MNNLKKILLLLAITLSLSPKLSLAEDGGSEGGGGENSVVCFSDPSIPAAIRDRNSPHYGLILDSEIAAITSVEAYDLYEAKMPRGLSRKVPQIIGEAESAREYVEKIAKRFEPYIPYVAFLARRGSSVFTDERIIARPAGLNRIHDENDVGYIEADHCVVATMAAQYVTGYDARLQLDYRLFGNAHHSVLSQGVLFLHESIYYSARGTYGHKDSRATRTFVGALINAAPTNSAAILELLGSLGLSGRYAGEWQAQNYLAVMMNKFVEDSQPALDKILKAQHAQNNTALAQRYNRWADAYFPITARPTTLYEAMLYRRRPDKVSRNKDGTYESVASIVEDDKVGICPANSSGCEATRKSILRGLNSEKPSLRRKAIEVMTGLANSQLFPALTKLPQFDEATKAKAKELMAQAIQKGDARAEETIPSNTEDGDITMPTIQYHFYGEESSLTELSKMSLPIP